MIVLMRSPSGRLVTSNDSPATLREAARVTPSSRIILFRLMVDFQGSDFKTGNPTAILKKVGRMNVFYCDLSPHLAARCLSDRHVVKMTLETAQILSTAARIQGADSDPLYKITHKNHPVVRACVSDPIYAHWVYFHGLALGEEYTTRFGKAHKSVRITEIAGELIDRREGIIENVPLAMPDEFRSSDPVLSYRNYLRAKYQAWADGGKTPRWKNSRPPEWLI